MKIELTNAQRAVVENRGGELLVSAAAGSGKTKVLVDRVLGMIAEGADIEDFLIITYTKAAAAELRVKLQKALQEAILDKRPGDYHRQLFHLNLAHISTVHSFCADLLREYAMYLQISPDFRICEEQEALLLKEKAMERTLDVCYQSMTESFAAFRECFGTGRNDKKLSEAIVTVHEKAHTRKEPEEWLENCLKMLRTDETVDLSNKAYGSYLIESFSLVVEECKNAYQKMMALIDEDEAISKACMATFQTDMQMFERYYACRSWDSLTNLGKPSFARLGKTTKCENAVLLDRIKNVREECKTRIWKAYDIFSLSSESHLFDLNKSAGIVAGAVEAAGIFGKEYRKEKARKHVLDFSDLEHETLRLLYGSACTVPNREAAIMSERFREVLVDEYQDSNSIQDAIFYAISGCGRKLFMVGDVKQSIYRFRLAEPRIFVRKYDSFPDYREVKDPGGRKIILSENFRSVGGILEAVNDVMRTSMSRRTGGIDYTDAELLRPGLESQYCIDRPVELYLMDGDTMENYEKVASESQWVAAKIREMIDSGATVRDGDSLRPCRYGDFAVLIRSPRNTSADFENALRSRNIPVFCDNSENVMNTEELQIVSSLLEILDNPRKDIPLAAVLMSPIFCFSSEDMALCRKNGREGSLYESIRTCQQEKAGKFLSLLDELRTIASTDGVSTALSCFLEKTDAMNVFRMMGNGENRIANIAAFLSQIIAQEKTGASPENLVAFIEKCRDRGMEGPARIPGDGVLITSIHKAKGLEYPVVVLPLISKQFNLEDSKERILFDSELGIGTNVVDTLQSITYPTVQKKAINEKMKRETVSEELRILYVAMTRARDRLIMLYSDKKLVQHLSILSRNNGFYPPDVCASRASSPGDWVLMEAIKRPESAGVISDIGPGERETRSDYPWKIAFVKTGLNAELKKENTKSEERLLDYSRIQAQIAFKYPFRNLASIPSKVAATQLKGRAMDGEVSENSAILQRAKVRDFSSFILSDSRPPEEIGTAMHTAIQYIDYGKCTSVDDVTQELQRLEREGFLTCAQKRLVKAEQIRNLFQSDMGMRILSADRVLREYKFSVMRPSRQLFPSGGNDELMIQGVADCAIFESGSISVIDYKTDRIHPGDERKRAEEYRTQVELYASALSDIFSMPVKDRIVFFLTTGESVLL